MASKADFFAYLEDKDLPYHDPIVIKHVCTNDSTTDSYRCPNQLCQHMLGPVGAELLGLCNKHQLCFANSYSYTYI